MALLPLPNSTCGTIEKWEKEEKMKNEKFIRNKENDKKKRKMNKFGFTRKILDDFQGLPLLL